MKKIFITAFILCLSAISFAQSQDADEVKSVLKQYNKAVGKLDVTGTEKLYTADSKIYESGGSEGNYAHYLEHHLGPELKEFKSFNFSDYKVEVTVSGEYAFSTETYIYAIVLAKDGKEIKSKGVATSVLKKTNEGWKIVSIHSSFRKAK